MRADKVTVLRLAVGAKPMAMSDVSASATTTFSGFTFHASATTWAKIVSMPCPCGQAPEGTNTLPGASLRPPGGKTAPPPAPGDGAPGATTPGPGGSVPPPRPRDGRVCGPRGPLSARAG